MKYVALNRLERMLVCRIRAETRRQSVALFDLSWEDEQWVTQIFAILPMPRLQSSVSTDSGATCKVYK